MNKKIKYVILLILTMIFVLILWSVLTGRIEEFDSKIYNFVTVNKNDNLTFIYKMITFLGSTVFMVVLTIFFLVMFYKNKKGGIIAVGIIISTIINNLIKVIVRRQRPIELMMVEENTFSFPSGHTMASVTMYGLLIYLLWICNIEKKWKIIGTMLLTMLIIGISLSRIYLGAHYASDVIASILISSIWLIIYTSFIKNKKLI